uniref:hypothetical protein n=1 Tax=Escherichia coli TaxID=562 RepID=UPI001BDBDA1E
MLIKFATDRDLCDPRAFAVQRRRPDDVRSVIIIDSGPLGVDALEHFRITALRLSARTSTHQYRLGDLNSTLLN